MISNDVLHIGYVEDERKGLEKKETKYAIEETANGLGGI